ncbi:HD domain-containing protein [Alteromonas gilva]|uniref:HDIG domain-containing protein n=1 Tax=Alteromonas gilva TaxID=2987522 RepID=A0ABT5KX58_9ALTE|nr:HD domain-containing protein [Alteromonas gilva]MDC8829354.1 HDIG domain-containing protein [Alteromonas gilva]
MTLQEALSHIQQLFIRYGNETYEEDCTQLQHAQQSATLALEWGLDEELALAAFLHDIGHFLAQDSQLPDFDSYGYASHDELGAAFLASCGFSARLCMLVAEHVNVKRYLASVDPEYLANLSHASTMTLRQQGGPMTPLECEQYAKNNLLNDIVMLRKLDDSGKLPAMECPALDEWMLRIEQHLTAQSQ